MTANWKSLATDLVKSRIQAASAEDLQQIAFEATTACQVKRPTDQAVRGWIQTLCGKAGILQRMRQDGRSIFIATDPSRPVPPALVAHLLRRTAIVSLHSVLGEVGILNNPSRIVYAIVEAGTIDATRPKSVANAVGEFRFVPMRPDVYHAGQDIDRMDQKAHYPKATPERALCDWLLLATPGTGMTYPPLDMDIEDLDMNRLHRLAAAMNITPFLDSWLQMKLQSETDVGTLEQSGCRTGL